MKLFEIKDYNLCVSEEAYGLLPFKTLIKKDKNRNKELALKELLFIYFYCDLRSDYQAILDLDEREIEIKKDIGLSDTWRKSKDLLYAIDFYKSRSKTISSIILEDTLASAVKVSSQMRYLAESSTLTPADAQKISIILKDVPNTIRAVQQAQKEVIKELENNVSKKGNQEFNLFEEGLSFE